MGQTKKILMDFEEKISILEDIYHILSSGTFGGAYLSKILNDLQRVLREIGSLHSSSLFSVQLALDLINDNDDIYDLFQKLKEIKECKDKGGKITVKKQIEFRKTLQELSVILDKLISLIQKNNPNRHGAYNSEEYYSDRINELQKQKETLRKQLEDARRVNKDIITVSGDEIELHKKEIQEKELQLQLSNEQIERYQKELDEKIKQESAVTEWNGKIKETFGQLNTYLLPIKKEHKRLTTLYWVYGILSAAVVVFLIFITYTKINSTALPSEFKDYISLMIPVSISGTLLWVFISQLNRAQRQLVVLAKQIHETEYLEGLLLSLNSLSTDINVSLERVNFAMDKLIENYLNLRENYYGRFDESSIIKEEKKDMIPYDSVLKLLKEVKNVAKK